VWRSATQGRAPLFPHRGIDFVGEQGNLPRERKGESGPVACPLPDFSLGRPPVRPLGSQSQGQVDCTAGSRGPLMELHLRAFHFREEIGAPLPEEESGPGVPPSALPSVGQRRQRGDGGEGPAAERPALQTPPGGPPNACTCGA
jgi:hypothetical protein